MLERIRYVLVIKRWRGGIIARLRGLWHYVVRRHCCEICGDCGRPVRVVWHAPDDLWLLVNGRETGVMCVPCFDDRARSLVPSLYLMWTPGEQA